MVPVLPLTRATWPPSCCAKVSTARPPSPESARRGSSPWPSSATVRRSSPGTRFSVTMTVPVASPGKAYLTAFVTSSFTDEPDRNCPIGRQELALDVGLEHDGRVAFL